MSASYHPQEIEPKWQKKWEEKKLFEAKDFASQPAYYALVEFPYPSGSGLHLGHAFTMAILDIFVRQKRMAGFNVLYPMGWDAFGLPTENYALKTGIHPAVATKQNTDRFRRQMKRLALAYNWEREINTSDPVYYHWTQWIFSQFFKYGLAYKRKMPVGWCPSCKTILANEEIINGKCERCNHEAEHRLQSQWLLRITAYADRLADELDSVDYPDYVKASQRNWIGRTQGVTIDYPVVGTSQKISCYTTRPDTNFGATFVVIAPEHPQVMALTTAENKKNVIHYIKQAQKKSELERTETEKIKTGVFTGRYCLNRLTGKKMPLWVADFVVLTAGTGVVVGVPAHDERDFAFAKKYGLEIIPVIRPRGKKTWDFKKAAFTDLDEAEVFNSDFLNGLPPLKAKKKIIDYLVKKGWGRRAVNYHLRDWIFSRQHYWGEPIPMIYCSACAEKGITWWDTKEGKVFQNANAQKLSKIKENQLASQNSTPPQAGLAGWFPVSESQLPVKLPKVKKYQPSEQEGSSPLADCHSWLKVKCPHCGGTAVRETDTMPNWAGSSWYFLRYCDPENSHCLADYKKLQYWLPVDLYLGGAEHTTLHLLYSRFWHKFLNDIGAVPGKEPYAARRQHGVILGEDGFRMSKSRGNVINPEQIIEKFGADTLRLYLMFMGPYDQTMPWSSKGVQGCWRFLNKVYRLVNQTQIQNSELKTKNSLKIRNLKLETRRIMHQTIKKVTKDIQDLKFNTAIAAIMEYVGAMSRLKSKNGKLPPSIVETLVLLLAPFTPFMAEELWCEVLGNKFSVHQQPWPKYDPRLVEEKEAVVVIQVNGKVRGQIRLPAAIAAQKSKVEAKAKKEANVARFLIGHKIKRVIFIPGRLINFVVF